MWHSYSLGWSGALLNYSNDRVRDFIVAGVGLENVKWFISSGCSYKNYWFSITVCDVYDVQYQLMWCTPLFLLPMYQYLI